MRRPFTITGFLFLALFLMCGNVLSDSRPNLVYIGTGSPKGLYYPTGGNIAKTVNYHYKELGFACRVKATDGSVSNINDVLAGRLDFGLAQSDRQHQAWMGLEEWKQKGRQGDLRAVFALYPEVVTLIASENSGIKSIQDLKGKRVNIGTPGSGSRQNALDALDNANLSYRRDLKATEENFKNACTLLQEGKIDALFYTVGHPSEAIKKLTEGKRKIRIISIANVDSLLAKYPYNVPAVIPMKFYPRAANRSDVVSFGVKATLITSCKVPHNVVYAVTLKIFENLEKFKKLNPAYGGLTIQNMVEGMSAVTHPGAAKYFHEIGLQDEAFHSDATKLYDRRSNRSQCYPLLSGD